MRANDDRTDDLDHSGKRRRELATGVLRQVASAICSITRRFAALVCVLVLPAVIRAGENGTSDVPVLRRPLAKVEALNIAIARNGTILQAKKDVEAATGVAIQTKAIVYPRVEDAPSTWPGTTR